MRYLSSLLLPAFLFCSTYKDRIHNIIPLRIEADKLAFTMDKREHIDKLSAENQVTVHFADKIVIRTDQLQYLDHERLLCDSPGKCSFSSGEGELDFDQLLYNLKSDTLQLAQVKGHLRILDQSRTVLQAEKLRLDQDNLVLEGNISLHYPHLGQLHAEKTLEFNESHVTAIGKVDLLQDESATPFSLHCDDQLFFDAKEQHLTVTSKEKEKILFETKNLKLYADALELNYEENRPVRVQLEGTVRIEPKNRYINFDTLLCDRVDFPLEEDAMLLVTNGRQQHLFWESGAQGNIFLGEGEIPIR